MLYRMFLPLKFFSDVVDCEVPRKCVAAAHELQLLALLRAVDSDSLFGDGGLAALDDSIAMGQPLSPAAAGAAPLPRRPGPLAQLILDGAAAAAAGDSPFDIDEEPAFDGTAAAAADAAVELAGGDGHPPPDDWALVVMGWSALHWWRRRCR